MDDLHLKAPDPEAFGKIRYIVRSAHKWGGDGKEPSFTKIRRVLMEKHPEALKAFGGNPDVAAAWIKDNWMAMHHKSFKGKSGAGPTFWRKGAKGKKLHASQDELSYLMLSNSTAQEDADGLIWKVACRTGSWAVNPLGGNGPLIIDRDLFLAIEEAFDASVFESVTVPKSHRNAVDENTGFVRKLRVVDDPDREGESLLLAAIDFTDPSVREGVLNGSITNVSVGIRMRGGRRTSDGKFFPKVLEHIALTPIPFIDGLRPFGADLSDLLAASAVWEPEYEETLLALDWDAVFGSEDSEALALAMPRGAWIADKHPRWPQGSPGGKGGKFMRLNAIFENLSSNEVISIPPNALKGAKRITGAKMRREGAGIRVDVSLRDGRDRSFITDPNNHSMADIMKALEQIDAKFSKNETVGHLANASGKTNEQMYGPDPLKGADDPNAAPGAKVTAPAAPTPSTPPLTETTGSSPFARRMARDARIDRAVLGHILKNFGPDVAEIAVSTGTDRADVIKAIKRLQGMKLVFSDDPNESGQFESVTWHSSGLGPDDLSDDEIAPYLNTLLGPDPTESNHGIVKYKERVRELDGGGSKITVDFGDVENPPSIRWRGAGNTTPYKFRSFVQELERATQLLNAGDSSPSDAEITDSAHYGSTTARISREAGDKNPFDVVMWDADNADGALSSPTRVSWPSIDEPVTPAQAARIAAGMRKLLEQRGMGDTPNAPETPPKIKKSYSDRTKELSAGGTTIRVDMGDDFHPIKIGWSSSSQTTSPSDLLDLVRKMEVLIEDELGGSTSVDTSKNVVSRRSADSVSNKIYVRDGESPVEVIVYDERKFGDSGMSIPAHAVWPSIGSVTLGEAERFTAGLRQLVSERGIGNTAKGNNARIDNPIVDINDGRLFHIEDAAAYIKGRWYDATEGRQTHDRLLRYVALARAGKLTEDMRNEMVDIMHDADARDPGEPAVSHALDVLASMKSPNAKKSGVESILGRQTFPIPSDVASLLERAIEVGYEYDYEAPNWYDNYAEDGPFSNLDINQIKELIDHYEEIRVYVNPERHPQDVKIIEAALSALRTRAKGFLNTSHQPDAELTLTIQADKPVLRILQDQPIVRIHGSGSADDLLLAMPRGAWISDKHPRWPTGTPGGKGGQFMRLNAIFEKLNDGESMTVPPAVFKGAKRIDAVKLTKSGGKLRVDVQTRDGRPRSFEADPDNHSMADIMKAIEQIDAKFSKNETTGHMANAHGKTNVQMYGTDPLKGADNPGAMAKDKKAPAGSDASKPAGGSKTSFVLKNVPAGSNGLSIYDPAHRAELRRILKATNNDSGIKALDAFEKGVGPKWLADAYDNTKDDFADDKPENVSFNLTREAGIGMIFGWLDAHIAGLESDGEDKAARLLQKLATVIETSPVTPKPVRAPRARKPKSGPSTFVKYD